MYKYKLTIFTPTYNRAYILPQLKESLLLQDNYDFEWLIIDDGSTDNTKDLVNNWIEENLPFNIHYYRTKNGGKPRAINKACQLAKSDWLFIIDSDDYLVKNSIGFINSAIDEIKNDPQLIGIGFLRGTKDMKPFGIPLFKEQIKASNLQRKEYGLNFDCNEVYKISILKHFPFEVWPNENFTPEEVTLNEIALNGYKLKWYNKIIVISEYLTDGMTKGAWNLMKNNPMGYAMLYNHKLKYTTNTKAKLNYICQFIAYCILSKNYSYIKKCNCKRLVFILIPLGSLLAIRRKWQFNHIL